VLLNLKTTFSLKELRMTFLSEYTDLPVFIDTFMATRLTPLQQETRQFYSSRTTTPT
jgi:hypothetical protein